MAPPYSGSTSPKMKYLFLSVNAFYQKMKRECYCQQVKFLRKLEKYGLLSTIFYKKGQFNSLLYPKKDNERKNTQNRRLWWNILKKSCFLLFSRVPVMTPSIFKFNKKVIRPFQLKSFSYFFVLLYLINYKIIMRSIGMLTLKDTVAVNKILETGDFNSSLPGIPWYSKSPLCIELEIYF